VVTTSTKSREVNKDTRLATARRRERLAAPARGSIADTFGFSAAKGLLQYPHE